MRYSSRKKNERRYHRDNNEDKRGGTEYRRTHAIYRISEVHNFTEENDKFRRKTTRFHKSVSERIVESTSSSDRTCMGSSKTPSSASCKMNDSANVENIKPTSGKSEDSYVRHFHEKSNEIPLWRRRERYPSPFSENRCYYENSRKSRSAESQTERLNSLFLLDLSQSGSPILGTRTNFLDKASNHCEKNNSLSDSTDRIHLNLSNSKSDVSMSSSRGKAHPQECQLFTRRSPASSPSRKRRRYLHQENKITDYFPLLHSQGSRRGETLRASPNSQESKNNSIAVNSQERLGETNNSCEGMFSNKDITVAREASCIVLDDSDVEIVDSDSSNDSGLGLNTSAKNSAFSVPEVASSTVNCEAGATNGEVSCRNESESEFIVSSTNCDVEIHDSKLLIRPVDFTAVNEVTTTSRVGESIELVIISDDSDTEEHTNPISSTMLEDTKEVIEIESDNSSLMVIDSDNSSLMVIDSDNSSLIVIDSDDETGTSKEVKDDLIQDRKSEENVLLEGPPLLENYRSSTPYADDSVHIVDEVDPPVLEKMRENQVYLPQEVEAVVPIVCSPASKARVEPEVTPQQITNVVNSVFGNIQCNPLARLQITNISQCLQGSCSWCPGKNPEKLEKGQLTMVYTQLFKYLVQGNLWDQALDFISGATSPTLYPHSTHLIAVLRGVLNIHEQHLVLKASSVFKSMLHLHPLCVPEMKEYYYEVLNGSLEEEQVHCDCGLFMCILDTLEKVLGETENQAPQETSPASPEQVSSSASSSTSQEKSSDVLCNLQNETRPDDMKNFNHFNKTTKASRLFNVLALLLNILEEDLVLWQARNWNVLRLTLLPKSSKYKKPLVARIIWPAGQIGCVNDICRKIIKIFVTSGISEVEGEQLTQLKRLVWMIAEVVYYSQDNREKVCPLLDDKCISFARKLSEQLAGCGVPFSSVKIILSTLKPAWLNLLVSTMLLEKFGKVKILQELNLTNLVDVWNELNSRYGKVTEDKGHSEPVEVEKEKGAASRSNNVNINKRNKIEPDQKLNILAVSENGVTPLHDAVRSNNLRICSLLLDEGGSSLLEAKTVDGYRPIDLAVSNRMRELLHIYSKENSSAKPKFPSDGAVLHENLQYSSQESESNLLYLLRTTMLSYISTYQTDTVLHKLCNKETNGTKCNALETLNHCNRAEFHVDIDRYMKDLKMLQCVSNLINNSAS